MSSESRLTSVDVAKGIGIVAVAFFHAVGFSAGGNLGGVVKSAHTCFGAVLGVFFFLSGYFYKPGKTYLQNAVYRTQKLLFPTMAVSLAVCVLGYFGEWIFVTRVPLSEYVVNYIRYVVDPFAFQPFVLTTESLYNNTRAYYFLLPLWFAYRLYFSELIFYALADRALKSFKHLLTTVLILLVAATLYLQLFSVHLPFQLECCAAYAAVILVGAYCGKHGLFSRLQKDYAKKEYWLIFAAVVILYILSLVFLKDYFGQRLFSGMFNSEHENGPEAVFFWFICQIIMCYITMFICSWIVRFPKFILKPVLLCGHSSMLILAFHPVLEWIIVNCFGRGNEIFLTRSQAVDGVLSTSSAELAVSVFVSIIICCFVDFLLVKIKGSVKLINDKR